MPEVNAGDPTGAGAGTTPGADVQGAQDAGDEQQTGAGREARYRVERNEARAEVERLSGVVEGLQKQMIEGMIGDLNAKAFWAGAGVEGVSDLLGEDGTVDAEKVQAAVGVARTELGIPEGPRAPIASPHQGQTYGPEVDAHRKKGGGFAEALHPDNLQPGYGSGAGMSAMVGQRGKANDDTQGATPIEE